MAAWADSEILLTLMTDELAGRQLASSGTEAVGGYIVRNKSFVWHQREPYCSCCSRDVANFHQPIYSHWQYKYAVSPSDLIWRLWILFTRHWLPVCLLISQLTELSWWTILPFCLIDVYVVILYVELVLTLIAYCSITAQNCGLTAFHKVAWRLI